MNIIRKYYYKILNELTINNKYFFYSLALSVYVFLAQLVVYDSKRQILATVISILVLFLLSKSSKIIFIVISLFALLINSVILHLTLHWGSSSLNDRLQAAMLSPKYEVVEYLSSYIGPFDIVIIIYVCAGITFLWLHLTKLNNNYRIAKGTSLLLLAIIFLAASLTNYIQRMSPYRYIPGLANASEWKNIIDKRLTYLNDLDNTRHSLPEGAPQYDKIVIVMGESVNRYQMGAYRYSIPTTPFLTDLLKQENSIRIDNVIAPANQTRFSITISLTDADVNNFDAFTTSKSIMTTFRDYGFKTYWLSNQYLAGKHDSYIASIASEANYTKTANYVYESGGGANSELDMILVDYLKEMNVKNSDKEVYFLHLLGSHFQYKKRYPVDFGLHPNPKNIVEEYDNTIHYTDTVLREIFNLFKGMNVLFIYLSDHADVVHLDKTGHGHAPTYRNEYDIPLIIHSSIVNNRLDVIAGENNNYLLNTESLNHLVLYLAGIESDASNISHNPKVIVINTENIVDYNTLDTYP